VKEFDQSDSLKKNWKSSFVTNTNDKTQGQYFFSGETIDVILSNLSKKKRILLVGCPSLLVPLYEKGFKVKLLDIDQRFLRIFPPDMFHLFNMMNCHFFTKKHDFDIFIQSKNLVIIADPPFGVQVSVLMRSLKLLAEKCEKVQFLVFFPWFHHKRFESYGLRPSDFRVTYAKHSKMNRNKTVRIFSNKLRKFKLPEDEYKFCQGCNRYVHKSQFHCEKCGNCADLRQESLKIFKFQ